MDQPRKLHSTPTLVVVAVASAILGFVAGFLIAKSIYDPDAGHIPCPPCKVVVNNAVSPSGCRLLGRIKDDWNGGPVGIHSPSVMYQSNDLKNSYDRGDCIDLELTSCPETGSKLWFTSGGAPFDNPLCFGSNCPEVAGCEN